MALLPHFDKLFFSRLSFDFVVRIRKSSWDKACGYVCPSLRWKETCVQLLVGRIQRGDSNDFSVSWLDLNSDFCVMMNLQ